MKLAFYNDYIICCPFCSFEGSEMDFEYYYDEGHEIMECPNCRATIPLKSINKTNKEIYYET